MDKIETIEQFDELKNRNGQLFIFKRSTRCPTSFIAFENFRRFSAAHPEIPCAYVNVIEERPVSNHIAAITGIQHQSPQVLQFSNGIVVWHSSHSSITEEALTLRS